MQAAEDAWNSRDPERVAMAYSMDSQWRNRDEFFTGRDEIKAFLTRKWVNELHYRLMKELWAFTDNRISVRFEYEWQHASTGQWYRTHGNEHCPSAMARATCSETAPCASSSEGGTPSADTLSASV